MQKIFLVIMTAFIMIGSTVEAETIKDHPTVAVMQFSDKAIKSYNVEGVRGQDFSSASEYAIFQLDASGWFDLVDYEQMTAAARMLSMYNNGLFEQSAAPAIGKFTSARYVLVGSLTGMTAKKSGAKVFGAGVSKYTVTANVTVRFVDVETLKIVGTGMGTGVSSSTKAEVSFKPFRNSLGYIGVRQVNINVNADTDKNKNVNDSGVISMDDPSFGVYFVKVNAFEVPAVQVRNALSKAVREAIYGDAGILTSLNNGIKLDIKKRF